MKELTPFEQRMESLFLDHPEGQLARQFLSSYSEFCHLIDDVIDKDKPQNEENISKILLLAHNIYSSAFYYKYLPTLYPIVRQIHFTYFDTVKMERSAEVWQQEYARVLKQCGDEMTLAIIEILGGVDLRIELGIQAREYTNKKQNEEPNQ